MSRHYLMCPPTYFAVAYSINPWMSPDEPVDVSRAQRQWHALVDTLQALGHSVTVMEPRPELPDMVFTANGGIAIGTRAMAPRFLYPERAAESEHFGVALTNLGYGPVKRPEYVNEGEGDFRFTGRIILAGSGFRSETLAEREVADFFGIPVVGLSLVDPRFYHLDTALAVLDRETLAYWPGAFTADSQAVLRKLSPDSVLASERDAAAFGLNMISDGRNAILAAGCEDLAEEVSRRGFNVIQVDMSELRKAGGGAKCCVLELHERPSDHS